MAFGKEDKSTSAHITEDVMVPTILKPLVSSAHVTGW
jgi:hypothetical protein